MHLLFVSSMLPEDEPTSGFALANRAIAEEYRRQGVGLTFAGFRRSGSGVPRPGTIALGDLAIENAGAGAMRKAAWVGRALAARLPVSAAKVAMLGEAELSARLDDAGPIDGVILNSIQMPSAYPVLTRGRPSIFIAHNVEHRSAAENAATARSVLSRRLYAREARLLERDEARVCREACVVHTLAQEDIAGLGLAGHRAAIALPLSIGRPARSDDGQRCHDVGLIGTWSWAPNRAGLDWFLSEVVPRLDPDMRIAIAGAFDGRPPRAPANVAFLGRVPDAQAFVRASRVIALASKGGTGVQLKTIETLEEGMPAVATPAALRGVSGIPGNVKVAEAAEDFAAKLGEAVREERAGRLARRSGLAFQLVQRRDLAAGVRRGLDHLESVLSGGRPRRPAWLEEANDMAAVAPRLAVRG